MKIQNVFLLTLVVICGVVSAGEFNQSPSKVWQIYTNQFGKRFRNSTDENLHYEAYTQNRAWIERIAGRRQYDFYMQTNKYSDLTYNQFIETMNGFQFDLHEIDRDNRLPNTNTPTSTTTPAPVAPVTSSTPFDWRTRGAVTPVKDQGLCASGWAFATTGAIEGQHFKSTGDLVSLSEQNLIDCIPGNDGCIGGYMDKGFEYVISNGGIDTGSTYVYKAKKGNCRFHGANIGATISGFEDIAIGSEAALLDAVTRIGPIAAGIDASQPSFVNYASGIYYDPACSPISLNHAVLVVGYGRNSIKGDYWILKNSWGTSWGEDGYMRLARNKNNHCGIVSAASYPKV